MFHFIYNRFNQYFELIIHILVIFQNIRVIILIYLKYQPIDMIVHHYLICKILRNMGNANYK